MMKSGVLFEAKGSPDDTSLAFTEMATIVRTSDLRERNVSCTRTTQFRPYAAD